MIPTAPLQPINPLQPTSLLQPTNGQPTSLLITPMLSSGMLTMITFLLIAAFIVLGSMSLRRHVRRANAVWEADLTEQGRAAERFEHQND